VLCPPHLQLHLAIAHLANMSIVELAQIVLVDSFNQMQVFIIISCISPFMCSESYLRHLCSSVFQNQIMDFASPALLVRFVPVVPHSTKRVLLVIIVQVQPIFIQPARLGRTVLLRHRHAPVVLLAHTVVQRLQRALHALRENTAPRRLHLARYAMQENTVAIRAVLCATLVLKESIRMKEHRHV
jgi:hypothetical protein